MGQGLCAFLPSPSFIGLTAATGDFSNETSAGAIGTPEKIRTTSAGARVGETTQRAEAPAA